MKASSSLHKYFSKRYTWNLRTFFKKGAKELRFNNNTLEIKTTPENLRSLLFCLKGHNLCKYKQLVEIACSDTPGKKLRFSIAYVLESMRYSAYIVLKVQTNEVLSVPSVTRVFSGAGWLEREIWDLFGIFFKEHPDLRRILTDYGFSGHPLRKDFPLTGFLEIFYNDSIKRMSYEPVELAQEYRSFVLQSPWIQNYKKINSQNK